jgi:murein DD-endopeptidase MepM/ murein hydrolase activator NlpD
MVIVGMLLAGCQARSTATVDAAGANAVIEVAAVEETIAVVATKEATEFIEDEQPTEVSTATANFEVCSPLQGFTQADLLARISNPFDPPAPGSDDPHQGVDLGDYDPQSANRMAVAGRTVLAALPGTVALVQEDRFPYGNAVLIETPLEALPAELRAQFDALADWPELSAANPLTCPQATTAWQWDDSRRSLYVLYGHLDTIAGLQVGDAVSCGEALGTVGQSGNALAPHLHFEARIGPSGARLGSLAHYDVSASTQEMAAYCEWRVSGAFIWVDPLELLYLVR